MQQREACLKLCFIKFCVIAAEKLNTEGNKQSRQTIAKYIFSPKKNFQFLFLTFHPGKSSREFIFDHFYSYLSFLSGNQDYVQYIDKNCIT